MWSVVVGLLIVVGCGRFHFDGIGDAGGDDASADDGSPDSAPVGVVTIAPLGGNNDSLGGRQRHAFYARGHYWVFLTPPDGSISYVQSADGVTWSAPIYFAPGPMLNRFDCKTDGMYVHTLIGPEVRGLGPGLIDEGPLQYRRGLLGADGSITWDPANEAVVAQTNRSWHYPTLMLDGAGLPWLLYLEIDTQGLFYNMLLTGSSSAATWTTRAGLPRSMGGPLGSWYGVGAAYGAQGALAVVSYDGDGTMTSAEWDGTNLGANTAVPPSNSTRVTSAVGSGSRFDLLFSRAGDGAMMHARYAAGWSTPVEVIAPGAAASQLSVLDAQTGELAAVWLDGQRVMISRGSPSGWSAPMACTDPATDPVVQIALLVFPEAVGGRVPIAFATAANEVRFTTCAP